VSVPVTLAGTLTILFLVGFGIFLYPWLLRRRGGALIAGALTAVLGVLFYFFDNPNNAEAGASGLLAAILAVLPLLTGLLVKYAQDKGISH
jgi:drug/metabolite transporter (DMT)-like permease